MVLRDCNRGMVHWPEEDRNLPVDVELQGEEIFLYFKGYKFQDSRFVSEIDFYDKQQGMIVTLAEVVMKRNPEMCIRDRSYTAAFCFACTDSKLPRVCLYSYPLASSITCMPL